MNHLKGQQTDAAESRMPVILVVDDDPNNLGVVQDSLIDMNYTILVAEDGETAIARALYTQPSLILLDVMMPGIDGYETCRRLKANPATAAIPVIFMTALAETGHKVKGLGAGAVDYVTKPFHQEELLARIAVHLQLQELTRKLLEANETLERRVEERTIDLSIANNELEEEIAERQAAQEQLQEQAIALEEKFKELQAAQSALAASEKELRQSHKMEAIGTLSAGIAHDFNNILMAILGFTEMAIQKLPENSAATANLEQVYASGMRAAELVRQILTYCRHNDQEKTNVHLPSVVKEVCTLLRSPLPATIEIRQEITSLPTGGYVHADPIQVHQILMNLGTNASHAMRNKCGVMGISLEEIDLDQTAVERYPDLKTGVYLRLTVSDTGHGMSPEVLERIFDPYFTTKNIGEGTGLGLSVVSGIVKNHGGMITVYSEPDKGTSFQIFLPVADEESAPSADLRLTLPGGNEHVLFVDDEEFLVSMGQEMLEGLGYRVTTVADAMTALTTFQNNPDDFDLVITDMTMPKMTGKELARELRAIRPGIPIIISSGYTEFANSKEILQAGVQGFLMKPYGTRNLAESIRMTLDDPTKL